MTTTAHPVSSAVATIAAPRTDRPSLGTIARGALIGGIVAVAASVVVFGLFRIGSPVRVITGWAPEGTDLGLPDLVITTIVSVAVAAAGLVVLDRITRRSLRTWTIVVAVVTVLSFLPLWRLDLDTSSKLALTTMHLVVGAAVVAGQLVVRRPAR